MMKILHFGFIKGDGYLRVFLFVIPFMFIYINHRPSNLDKLELLSTWSRMVFTQLMTKVYKDSLSPFDAHQISIFDWYTILIPFKQVFKYRY